MSNGSPPLRADHLTVSRGAETIFSEVSLTIKSRSRTLIRGLSGAGKSTLFEALGLLARPDGGVVHVGGTAMNNTSERARARARNQQLGLIFQDFRLVPDLTAWENAVLPLQHTRDGPTDSEISRLSQLFDTLGISDLRKQTPPTLSGGERQRVAIARALVNEPNVVLADEPTGQLDPESSEQVRSLLYEMQTNSETALVVISHDRSFGPEFGTIYNLSDGGLRKSHNRST